MPTSLTLVSPRFLRLCAACWLTGALWTPQAHAANGRAKSKKAPPATAARAPKTPATPPAAPIATGTGTLFGAGGDGVAVKLGAADWKVADQQQPIGPGARIRTGAARVTALEVDGARFWLDPGTQLALPAATDKKGTITMTEGAARVAYDAGTGAGPPIGAAGAKGGRVLRLALPDGELRLRGAARVEIPVGPPGQPGLRGGWPDLLLAIYDGQAEYAPKRGAVLKLPAGSGAVVRRAGKQRVGGLIGAPRWAAGPTVFFLLPQPGATTAEVTLPFQRVEGATRYRLEVGRDEALLDRQSLGSAATVAADARAVTARLGRGRYFVRLQAVDGDRVAGPGLVQAIEVVEVHGERVAVSQKQVEGGARLPLLSAAGELRLDLLPGQGKLAVQVDGQQQEANAGVVSLRLGHGHHTVHVAGEAGAQGDFLADVSRPSYAVELVQGRLVKSGRHYEVRVKALRAGGYTAQVGAQELKVLWGQQKLALADGGVELDVEPGQTQKLVISDAEGVVAGADLHGSQE